MAFLMALALGIGLLFTPSPRSWSADRSFQVAQAHPAIQECGRRGEFYSDQRWVACVDDFNRRIEQERQQRLQDYYKVQREIEQRQQMEAERRRQMELEERRVRALEGAAQAQRDAADAANQTRTCKTVGYQLGRPIIECYTPNIPASRYGQ